MTPAGCDAGLEEPLPGVPGGDHRRSRRRERRPRQVRPQAEEGADASDARGEAVRVAKAQATRPRTTPRRRRPRRPEVRPRRGGAGTKPRGFVLRAAAVPNPSSVGAASGAGGARTTSGRTPTVADGGASRSRSRACKPARSKTESSAEPRSSDASASPRWSGIGIRGIASRRVTRRMGGRSEDLPALRDVVASPAEPATLFVGPQELDDRHDVAVLGRVDDEPRLGDLGSSAMTRSMGFGSCATRLARVPGLPVTGDGDIGDDDTARRIGPRRARRHASRREYLG